MSHVDPDILSLSVKVVTARGNKGTIVRVHKDAQVSEIANIISERFKVPPHNQRIVYLMRELKHESKITDGIGLSRNGTIIYVFDLGNQCAKPKNEIPISKVQREKFVAPVFGRCPSHGTSIQIVEIALVCPRCFEYGRNRTKPGSFGDNEILPLDWRMGVEVIYSSQFKVSEVVNPGIRCSNCDEKVVPLITGMKCGCESLCETDVLWNVVPNFAGLPKIRFTCNHAQSVEEIFTEIDTCSKPENLLAQTNAPSNSPWKFLFKCKECVNKKPNSDEFGVAHLNTIRVDPSREISANKKLVQLTQRLFGSSERLSILGEENALHEKQCMKFAHDHSVPCPQCSTPYLKTDDGCNHVQCGKCKTHFCYFCGKSETELGGDLFDHNRDPLHDSSCCYLYMEDHPWLLNFTHPLDAVLGFHFWRAVRLMYNYGRENGVLYDLEQNDLLQNWSQRMLFWKEHSAKVSYRLP